MMIASRSDGYSRYSHANSRRSMFRSLTRVGGLRRRTTSCWRRMRFSASSRARRVNCDRIASSSWVRNATIGASLPYAHPRVIPDKVFGRHRDEIFKRDDFPTLDKLDPHDKHRKLLARIDRAFDAKFRKIRPPANVPLLISPSWRTTSSAEWKLLHCFALVRRVFDSLTFL